VPVQEPDLLDRHRTAEQLVATGPDPSHAAVAEGLLEAIATAEHAGAAVRTRHVGPASPVPAALRLLARIGCAGRLRYGRSMSLSVRPAVPGDVAEILAMIRELAEFEREPDAVEASEALIETALFGPTPAAFAHVATTDDGATVGFALWFLNFSTWRGRHGIYLEDLYVRPAARGSGAGRALLTELARLCVARGYGRLEWWVLDWNADAHAFYGRLGAVPMDEWTVWRLTGAALERLGSGASRDD
jgi:GNAT superfamily N-acetyltransferase